MCAKGYTWLFLSPLDFELCNSTGIYTNCHSYPFQYNLLQWTQALHSHCTSTLHLPIKYKVQTWLIVYTLIQSAQTVNSGTILNDNLFACWWPQCGYLGTTYLSKYILTTTHNSCIKNSRKTYQTHPRSIFCCGFKGQTYLCNWYVHEGVTGCEVTMIKEKEMWKEVRYRKWAVIEATCTYIILYINNGKCTNSHPDWPSCISLSAVGLKIGVCMWGAKALGHRVWGKGKSMCKRK